MVTVCIIITDYEQEKALRLKIKNTKYKNGHSIENAMGLHNYFHIKVLREYGCISKLTYLEPSFIDSSTELESLKKTKDSVFSKFYRRRRQVFFFTACMHAYINEHTDTYRHTVTESGTYNHTNTHTNIHAYVDTDTHVHIYTTYMHTETQTHTYNYHGGEQAT